MRAFCLLVVPALTIAGCSNEKTVTATNASVEEVQNQVAAAGGAISMKPGQWEGTASVKMPTAGGQTATQPIKACITEDQVKPGSNPFAGQLGQGCKYDHFKMDGGKIDAAMTCDIQGMKMKTAVNGEFTPESYKINSTSEASGGPAGAAGMKTETVIEARRTGDCAAGATKG